MRSLANDLLAEKESMLLLSSEEWIVLAFAFPKCFYPQKKIIQIFKQLLCKKKKSLNRRLLRLSHSPFKLPTPLQVQYKDR